MRANEGAARRMSGVKKRDATSTGSATTFKTVSVAISKVTQIHDLYLTFAGGTSVGNMSWFKFS